MLPGAAAAPEVRKRGRLNICNAASICRSWMLDLPRAIVCRSSAQRWRGGGVAAVEGRQYQAKLAPRLTTEPYETQHHNKLH